MSVYIAENLGSFGTQYYKDDIAENWELLPPKWKKSIFSILQSRHCRKFGNISQQNIGSIHSPNNSDTTENLGTHGTNLVRSLDSPYYRGDIAENLGTFPTKMEGV